MNNHIKWQKPIFKLQKYIIKVISYIKIFVKDNFISFR